MSTVSAPSTLDTVRDRFNFSIEKFPLGGPDGLRTPWYGLFRSDTNEVVGGGSVTAKYVPHTTDDVLALCEAASTVFEGVGEVNCYFRDGHYVFVQPSVEQRKEVFGTADNVWPRLMISAGYDGKAFKASIGYYRDLCRNMHIIRAARETTVSIRHTCHLRSRMDELIGNFQTLQGSWKNVGIMIDRMENNRVSMVNFLDALYGKPDEASKRSMTEHRNRTEAIFRRLQNEVSRTGRDPIGSDFTVSGWMAFNAVQGYIQHEKTLKGRNKNAEGFNILRSLSDTVVQRAEELALAC
jgi:hypothetical protein